MANGARNAQTAQSINFGMLSDVATWQEIIRSSKKLLGQHTIRYDPPTPLGSTRSDESLLKFSRDEFSRNLKLPMNKAGNVYLCEAALARLGAS